MPKQVSPKIIALTFGVLIVSFLVAFYVVAWQEPPYGGVCTNPPCPPGGNVPAPLNVGPTGQPKEGWLASLKSFFIGSEPTEAEKATTGVLRTTGGAILNTGEAVNGLIVQSGNVGIGTASPGALLHLSATNPEIYFTKGSTSNYSGLRFFTGSITDWFVGLREVSPGNDFSIYSFGTGAEAIRIQRSTGNVGIGTTTPSQKLDVNGIIKSTGFQMPTGAGMDKVLTSDISGTGSWQTPAMRSVYYRSCFAINYYNYYYCDSHSYHCKRFFGGFDRPGNFSCRA